MADRVSPPGSFGYVHCDIPADMTIAQYRAQRAIALAQQRGSPRLVRRVAAVVARASAFVPTRR